MQLLCLSIYLGYEAKFYYIFYDYNIIFERYIYIAIGKLQNFPYIHSKKYF